MYKYRRNEINSIQDRLIEIKTKLEVFAALSAEVADIKEKFEQIKDAHQGDFDKRSDAWQEGENGQSHSDELSAFENIYSTIEDLENKFDADDFNSDIDSIVNEIEDLKGTED
jgi:uncharacterized protein YukE